MLIKFNYFFIGRVTPIKIKYGRVIKNYTEIFKIDFADLCYKHNMGQKAKNSGNKKTKIYPPKLQSCIGERSRPSNKHMKRATNISNKEFETLYSELILTLHTKTYQEKVDYIKTYLSGKNNSWSYNKQSIDKLISQLIYKKNK